MYKLTSLFTAVVMVLLVSNLYSQHSVLDTLTIQTAIKTAIKNNQELKVLAKNIEIQKANKLQSGLMPNPELSIEAENIFGRNTFSGFRNSEITTALSQTILLSGKIGKLQALLDKEISIAKWNYDIKRTEIITEVRKAFCKVFSSKKILAKNYELIKISRDLIDNLKKRVNAGKISPAEVSRSQIILNSLELNVNKLKTEYDNSLLELKTLMNDYYSSSFIVKGKLNENIALPNYDSLQLQVMNNPRLQKSGSEFAKQKAKIIFEKSVSIPDLTITAGYKRLNEINANTFLLGLSVPLPIFNRNQGTIQKAEIKLSQKKIEFNYIKNKLSSRLFSLYNKLKMLLNSADKLKNESIPIAENSFELIRNGNLVGRFTILDVLDSQRTLFEIQNQYLEILKDINLTAIEIEGLTLNNFTFKE